MIIPFFQSKYTKENPPTHDQYNNEISDIKKYYSDNYCKTFDALDNVSYKVWERSILERYNKANKKSQNDHNPIDYYGLYDSFMYDDFKKWDYPSEEKLTDDLKLI